jgi:CheY-like chemotaxis protein
VVDDNSDSAESLAQMLRLRGHAVSTAHDGVRAIEACAALRPDVVLLDIGLPELNGYQVAHFLRELPFGEELLLVAVTGWGQEEDKLRSRAAGIDHHLVKPVSSTELDTLLMSFSAKRATA